MKRRPSGRPHRHPRRGHAGRRDGPHRHGFHRAQPAHVPVALSAVLGAESVDTTDRDEHVGSLRRLWVGVRGRQGSRRSVRPTSISRQFRLLAAARPGSSVSSSGPEHAGEGPSDFTWGVLAARGLFRLFRVALRRADRLICLVGGSRCGFAVSRSVFVRLFGQPRDVVV